MLIFKFRPKSYFNCFYTKVLRLLTIPACQVHCIKPRQHTIKENPTAWRIDHVMDCDHWGQNHVDYGQVEQHRSNQISFQYFHFFSSFFILTKNDSIEMVSWLLFFLITNEANIHNIPITIKHIIFVERFDRFLIKIVHATCICLFCVFGKNLKKGVVCSNVLLISLFY